jgi:cobalamin biosynthesis protein CbiM
MHVPDGFLDVPVSLGAGVIAVAGVGLSVRRARRDLDDRTAPLAGVVAAFVFAAQMVNFPVAAGTSGHLVGGALVSVLVGPYVGALCLAVVLFVQLFFADGGLSALGVNISTMALAGVWSAYVVVALILKVLPRGRPAVVIASAAGALLSVPAAAAVFTGFFALGGVADVPTGTVLAAMVPVHVLIGIGEALITAVVVGSVMAVRPDLVYVSRGPAPEVEIRTGPSPRASSAEPAPEGVA